MLEKTPESPLDCKEIHPVHRKGNQSWIFIGRTDVEAETPIFWPPDAKNWLIWNVQLLSHVPLFVTPWTAAHQAPLSMRFSRQVYWSGWPFPPPGDAPNPGIKPKFLMSPASIGRFFASSATWEAHNKACIFIKSIEEAMGSSRWSFPLWPGTHLLLYGLVPDRMQTSSSPWGLGTSGLRTSKNRDVASRALYAWRIPGTGKPGGLLSMRSHKVR